MTNTEPPIVNSNVLNNATNTTITPIIKYSHNNINKMIQQYESLPNDEVPQRTPNQCHDRYHDVLPGEDRVKVMYNGNQLYINANHAFGDMILTQAPLIHGLLNFWLMVAQHNVDLIVMLTRVMESGRAKANVYWPKEGDNLTFRQNGATIITIKNLSEHIDGECVYRDLHIDYCGKVLSVTHIQYIGWPDCGVPRGTSYIKNIMCKIQQSNRSVIHCSAGIGRTGALALAIQLLRCDDSPITVLKELRTKRPKSIQTAEQFKFALQLVNCIYIEKSMPRALPHVQRKFVIDTYLSDRDRMISSLGLPRSIKHDHSQRALAHSS